jgi:hypothetical protein
MEVKIKQSKPITELKKGDKVKIDGREFEIDAHVVLIEHDKNTREMALELFDAKTDEDFQIRYFSNNIENSLEFYELKNEFMYSRVRGGFKKIEW